MNLDGNIAPNLGPLPTRYALAGAVFLGLALLRFRRMVASTQ